MKKKFVALLISATMISANLAMPAYAESEIVSVEEDTNLVEEENLLSGNGSTISGGNIDWGSSNATLPTDVTSAKIDCIFLGVRGSYITDMQNALNRINEIRKEACDEGIKDPRDESRNLTSSDYVPIKWSSDLEYIARIRAAEASVYRQHIRLNGDYWFCIKSPNGIQSYGEVLAWNNTKNFLQGLEQCYSEKSNWLGSTSGETGHYTQMINPDNIYVGLAAFVNSNAKYTTTMAGEFTCQAYLDYDLGMSQAVLDESAGPAIENCLQTLEIQTSNVTSYGINGVTDSLAANDSLQAEFSFKGYAYKMEPLEKVTWTSSDTKTAKVDSTGKITGVHEGTADITASCGDFTATKIVQVTGHDYGAWKTTSQANVFSPAIQTRVCSVCNASQEKIVGSKLAKTMKVTLTSIPLKTKQKINVLKVYGLASGDSVASWKSSNTSIVKVSGKANGSSSLTAGSKTGKAKITITLKSGLQKTVTVSVQKSAVKTTKISGVVKSLTLKIKQKKTLAPCLTPLTSTEKITYKTSNSKVATVSSKGQIVAKKKGTAVITVKSGSKIVKCKVTVK